MRMKEKRGTWKKVTHAQVGVYALQEGAGKVSHCPACRQAPQGREAINYPRISHLYHFSGSQVPPQRPLRSPFFPFYLEETHEVAPKCWQRLSPSGSQAEDIMSPGIVP